jgi:hypothetical protein
MLFRIPLIPAKISGRELLCFAVTALSAISLGATGLEFNRDIRPILSENCFACHGSDAHSRKGKRRLDTFEGATAERDGVQAIVPGDLSKSELWFRITSNEEDERMPPKESHKALSGAQKDTLKRWIEEGAHYQIHWAYVVPERKPPNATAGANWARNDIDRFIAEKLAVEKLKPAPEADKATLIRRVSLDLIGLPPKPADVAAFLADSSAEAYERVVDRLLHSPHFGERMAVDWLDAARYADTNGYQIDRDREIWAWRDWVINAFNANMPFDRFTIEQLAGDLLPNATLEQRVATGFNRNSMINEEGGIIAEEFLAEYAADRVETTAAVWLAQTFMCTRCHDHKFDPLTQRDYYSLKAFFNNVPMQGKAIRQNQSRFATPPYVKLPSPELDSKVAEMTGKLKALEATLSSFEREPATGMETWVSQLNTTKISWRPLTPIAASADEQKPFIDGASHTVTFESLNNTRQDVTVRAIGMPAARITGLRLTCADTGAAATFNWTELAVQVERPGRPSLPLKLRSAEVGDSLPATTVELVHDGNRESRAVLAVKPGRTISAVFELSEPREFAAGETAQVVFTLGSNGATGSSRWLFEVTDADDALFVSGKIASLAKARPEQRSEPDRAALRASFSARQPRGRDLVDAITTIRRQISDTERNYAVTMVMEEMEKPRNTYILVRGAYDKKGERVTPNTPAILPGMDRDAPRNRLGLAQWLVRPDNPLTSRVTVNRLWQLVFGTGLVKTSEDFGSQGKPPSHPELLDWLATELIRQGWDIKAMMRLLVTSATYRQQSHFTAGLLEHDPEDRWLARAPRFRLPGEFIRDQALAASGLLVPSIGGPSVHPYHPAGLYEGVASTNDDAIKTYPQDHGRDLYRRSLYTYWKRSVPHPALVAFDVPLREVCVLKRSRTNTPSQALNLMNDPTYIEAARFLAQRMILEGGANEDSRLSYGFRLILARSPKAAELAILRGALERTQKDFSADIASATRLIEVGEAVPAPNLSPTELAAYTTVASTMLSLDETITRQ